MLIRIGNRYIETDAIAAASYRPGRDAIYDTNDEERLIREPVPHGISIRLVSGGFDYEFEGDEVLPLKEWLDNKSGYVDSAAKTRRPTRAEAGVAETPADPFAGRTVTPFVSPEKFTPEFTDEPKPSPQGAVAPSGVVTSVVTRANPQQPPPEEDDEDMGDDMDPGVPILPATPQPTDSAKRTK